MASTRLGRPRRTIVVLVLASLTILTLDARSSGVVDRIRAEATDLLAPAKTAAQTVFRPVEDVWNGIFRYREVKAENERLRTELDQIRGREAALTERERRAAELEALNGITWIGDLPSVTAELIGPPPSNFDQSVQLDRGADSGVKIGMPVVTGAGLLGRVVRVTPGRSFVRLVTDPILKVGVSLPASPELGFSRGRGAGNDLDVLLVASDAQVNRGDPVITSGQDESLFPAGIPVGTVSSVRSREGDLDLEVRATPVASATTTSVVRVILYTPPR